MKKTLFLLMGLVLFTILPQGGYAQVENQTENHQYVTGLVQQVLTVYNSHHHYPHDKLLIQYGDPVNFTASFLPGGGKRLTLLYAEPGNIYVNAQSVVTLNSLWHEVFHTYKPFQPNLLSSAIGFRDGHIIGTQGLNIRVRLHSGEVTGFSALEESAAEYLAFITSARAYTVSSPEYSRIGSLMIKVCNHYGLTATDILMYQSSPDGVFKFLKRISGQSVIKTSNIFFIMDIFSEVRFGQKTADQGLQDLMNHTW